MINWKEIAEQNGLSPNDLAVEIFSAACAIAAVRMDEEESEGMKFTCSDDVGVMKMVITREAK